MSRREKIEELMLAVALQALLKAARARSWSNAHYIVVKALEKIKGMENTNE